MNYPKVLKKILKQKESEISKISDFSFNHSSPTFSLKKCLLSQKGSIIAECKKASPSKGVIRVDYNPLQIALEYQTCGAKAISVLTDEKFFQGSLHDLQQVANHVSLPVIRKDFLIHEKQIFESRYFGASAVLLIVRILEQNQLKVLYELTRSLHMEALVEVHTLEEAKRAMDIGADIIGINTRDLDTLEMHPELIPEIASKIPKDILVVGESGIKSSSDYLQMLPYVQSVLIGTYFMESNDITSAFQKLTKSE